MYVLVVQSINCVVCHTNMSIKRIYTRTLVINLCDYSFVARNIWDNSDPTDIRGVIAFVCFTPRH